MPTAILRAQLQSVLVDVEKHAYAVLPTGVAALDDRIGGLPRGGITEISGPVSSGKTSIALSILAAATKENEACALIDGRDAFDPVSGVMAGVDLERLL